jgi:hypothetical protein
MWIVKLEHNLRHSAWRSRQEAMHQAEVLASCGYMPFNWRKRVSAFIEHDATVQCENGHYYV